MVWWRKTGVSRVGHWYGMVWWRRTGVSRVRHWYGMVEEDGVGGI